MQVQVTSDQQMVLQVATHTVIQIARLLRVAAKNVVNAIVDSTSTRQINYASQSIRTAKKLLNLMSVLLAILAMSCKDSIALPKLITVYPPELNKIMIRTV
jgi:hypothetical protein